MRKRRAAQKGQSGNAEMPTPVSPKPPIPPKTTGIVSSPKSPKPQIAQDSELPPGEMPKTPEKIAEEVAMQTRELLDTKGYVAWKCSQLDDPIIIIIRDKSVTDYPKGYPVFTEDEIKADAGNELSTTRLIIEAKKEVGAEIDTQGRLV